jgi:hypothetical protein
LDLLSKEIGLARSATIAAIQDSRAKQSRHEYIQESALARIELNGERVLGLSELRISEERAADGRSGVAHPPRILFVTSNGAGMGHIARCLAITSRSGDEIDAHVVTLSRAATFLQGLGYDVSYFPSQDVAELSWPEWHRRFGGWLSRLVSSGGFGALVFDGTWVYRSVTDVARYHRVPLIWMRRDSWKEGSDRLQYDNPYQICDVVLRPGEPAEDPDGDASGPVRRVGPISLVTPDQLVSREDALAQLDLDPEGSYVVVQLGAGNIDDPRGTVQQVVARISAARHGITPVLVVSELSQRQWSVSSDVLVRKAVFPLARYFNAFEFGVFAAGYNSVVEAISLGLPALFVPNTQTVTDDQVARARRVDTEGLALGCSGTAGVEEKIDQLLDPDFRSELRRRLADTRPKDGALEALEEIVSIVRRRERIPEGPNL